jgi:hypothetical protein
MAGVSWVAVPGRSRRRRQRTPSRLPFGRGAVVVRLWPRSSARVNPQTGVWVPLESLSGHGGDVTEAEFDPVRQRLITIARGDRVIIWNVGPADGSATGSGAATGSDRLRAACEVAGRDLTPMEWRRYVPGRPWRPTCTDLD